MVDYPFLMLSVFLLFMEVEGQYLFSTGSWLDLDDFAACHGHSESILEMEAPKSIFFWGLFDIGACYDFVGSGIECPCGSEEQDGFIEWQMGGAVDVIQMELLAFFDFGEELLEIYLFRLHVVAEGETADASHQD